MNKKISVLYNKLYSEAKSEKIDKKFFMKVFTTCLTAIFFLGFALTNRNPFSLLVPFSFYELDLPLSDKRVPAKVYLSDGRMNVYPSDRKVLLTGEFRKDLHTLITQVSAPPFYEIEENFTKKGLKVNLKKLPNLHFALITIWFNESGRLILDLRESSIQTEISILKVRVDRGTYELKEEVESESLSSIQQKEDEDKILVHQRRMEILHSTFLAIEKTIFDNFPEIKSIEFRLDGETKDYPDLNYKLSEVKNRI